MLENKDFMIYFFVWIDLEDLQDASTWKMKREWKYKSNEGEEKIYGYKRNHRWKKNGGCGGRRYF